MPDTDLRPILDPEPVDKSIKRKAWDAWHSASDQTQFRAAFDNMPISREAKRKLWDAKFSTKAPSRPKPEGFIEGVGKDLSIGWRGGVADLEHTGANLANMIGSKDTAASLEAKSKATAPTQEEMLGREGVGNAIAQGIGSLPTSVVKYAPAMAAKRLFPFATPIVAGLTDAAGAADKGWKEAGKSALATGLAFEGQELASKLPTRLGRTIGSAVALGAPAAYETGGDIRKTAAAAALGAATGGISKDPLKAKTPEALKQAKEVYTSAKDDFQKVLSPTSRGEPGAQTARIARANIANLAQKTDRAEFSLREARNYFDGQKIDKTIGTSNAGLNFIDAIETGQIKSKITDPKLQGQAQALRDAFDDRYKRLQKEGLLQAYTENYFPHIWKKPELAQQAYAMIGRRPFEGTKGFLRQRKFDTIKEGLDFAQKNPQFGLELADANPVDTVIRKLRDMDRLLTARDIMRDMKKSQLLKYVSTSEKAPPGYAKIDDKISTVQFRSKGMVTIAGNWYAPESAARVINNYLSPGLKGKAWFRGANLIANSLNQFQLGFSAFHLGFSTYESLISNYSLGLEKIIHGTINKDAKFIAGGFKDWLAAPARAVEPLTASLTPGGRGRSVTNQVWEEWMNPGSHPQVAPVVEMMKQAGARVQMDPFYRTQMWRSMKQSWVNGNKLAAGLKAFPAITEYTMRPIMEYVVPRQKISAFMKLAEFEMSRLPNGVSQDVVRKSLQNAWQTVDNRLGQMVYDNQFWNQTAKDMLQMSIRSVGWNFGTFAELGGGVKDAASFWKRLNSTNPADRVLTHKMAYLMTLPTVTGLIGAISTYLVTGKAPQEAKDLFFPKTGGQDEYGRPERYSLPTYMNDMWKWQQHIRQEGIGTGSVNIIKGKLHPIVPLIADMIQNSDWQGNKVHDPDANFIQQRMQDIEFVGKELLPFAWKNTFENLKAERRGAPPPFSNASQIASKFGIMPATAAIKKTDAEAYLDQVADANRRSSDHSVMGEKRFQHIRDLERSIRLHQDQAKIEAEAQKWIDAGELHSKDLEEARKRAETQPLVRRFQHVADFQTALKAYRLALFDDSIPAEEIDQVRQIMQVKVYKELEKMANLPPDDPMRTRTIAKLKELGLDAGTTAPPPNVK